MPEMLSNEEIAQLWKESWQRSNPYAADESTINLFARAVESAVESAVENAMREPMTCGHVTANWQRDDSGHECCLGCVEKRDAESAVLRKAVEMVREVGATYNALGEQVCSEVADFLKGRWKP